MNVKVVLDGHSTNASEMQHNIMEGIKKTVKNVFWKVKYVTTFIQIPLKY